MKSLDVKHILDKAELTQTIIIIAGFAVSATITTGALSSTLMNKGEAAAGCIANSSGFTSGGTAKVNCEELNEKAIENSRGAIIGSFGTPAQVDSHNKKTAILKAQKKDLMDFAKIVEQYQAKHKTLPKNPEEILKEFPFKVDRNNYPADEAYNFDYCRTLDGTQYIVTIHTGFDETMYVSSNNSTPKKYALTKEMRKEQKNYVSSCYSGTDWSAADRAGLNQVGQFDENGKIIPSTMGRNGINDNSKVTGGWAIQKS